MSYKVRFFPFSPGIPWKLKCGKYVEPDIPPDAWNIIREQSGIITVAFGGLIESFTSLCILEVLNFFSPRSKLFWCGDSQFSSLAAIQGLGSNIDNAMNVSILEKYPVPIFMDRKKNVYFNCLCNYLRVNTYYGEFGYKDKSPIVRQIVKNSTQMWDPIYLPKLRNMTLPKNLLDWAKISKFHFNTPYICVFPDRTGMSQHEYSMLNWSPLQVKSFAAMMKQYGYLTLVFTKHPENYYNSVCYTLPPRLDFILFMLSRAKAVLSREVDFLLVAGMMSEAKLIARKHPHRLNVKKNCRFLGCSNDIYLAGTFTPTDVVDFIIGES